MKDSEIKVSVISNGNSNAGSTNIIKNSSPEDSPGRNNNVTPTVETPALKDNTYSHTIENKANSMFLSPRVIDCESYNDFAGALKALIQQAAAMMCDLQVSVSDGNQVAQMLKTGTNRYQERLNLGGKLLKAIEQEIDRSENIAKTLTQHSDNLEKLEKKTDYKVESLITKIDEMVSDSDNKLQQRQTDMVNHIEHLTANINDAQGKIGNIEQIITGKMLDLQNQVDQIIQPAITTLEQKQKQITDLIGPIKSDSTISSVDNTATASGGTLTQIIQQALQLKSETDFAAKQMESIRDQWNILRNETGNEMLEAAEKIDALVQKQQEIEAIINQAQSPDQIVRTKIDTELELLNQDIEKRISKLSIKGNEVNFMLKESLNQLDSQISARLEQINNARGQIDADLNKASEFSKELDEMIQLQAESSARIQSLLTKLSPWESIINVTQKDNKLPQQFQQGIAAVRKSLNNELVTLGTAILSFAQSGTNISEAPAATASGMDEPETKTSVADIEIHTKGTHNRTPKANSISPVEQPAVMHSDTTLDDQLTETNNPQPTIITAKPEKITRI